MHKDSIIFPQFLRTDFDNVEQIEQLVYIIPSANEPFAADVLYEHLFNALSSDEQNKYSSTCTPQNLKEIIFKQKDILKRLTSEINKIIKRYNEANKSALEIKTINALIEKEINLADTKIPTEFERSKMPFPYILKAKNIRQYLYINLLHILLPFEDVYTCTHCKKWVYNPSRKQISTFKRTGTILHEECRKGRKSEKSLQRRKHRSEIY